MVHTTIGFCTSGVGSPRRVSGAGRTLKENGGDSVRGRDLVRSVDESRRSADSSRCLSLWKDSQDLKDI